MNWTVSDYVQADFHCSVHITICCDRHSYFFPYRYANWLWRT